MKPVGYQKLIETFALEVCEPIRTSWVRDKGSERISRIQGAHYEEIYPPRYNPGEGWQAQLAFALKHEGVNLEVLAALFQRLPLKEFTVWVKSAPNSRYVRIAWFLHEWFGGPHLPVPNLTQGNYIPVLDEKQYYVPPKQGVENHIRRQRLIDNMPGTPAYCPMVRRTNTLKRFEAMRLDEKAAKTMRRFPRELIQRATRFLYVKETKSSYAIEKLDADQKRTARFVALLERAGKLDCYSKVELIQLQNAIVDTRYAARGFRDFQNYVGQSLGPAREWVHYVPPKPGDLPKLMEGWMTCCRHLEQGGVHPVITAAVAGYGFIFLHPFEDGNGRLHRFLIQHALSAGGFGPSGVLFPVSAVILKQMDRYDASLEAYSRQIVRLVDYKLNDQGAMTVSGDSKPLYSFPDLTAQAEALFGFIEDTIRLEMTAELEFLSIFDAARKQLRRIVDMPDGRLDLFLRTCLQGKGSLSRTKRKLFRELNDEELLRMEAAVKSAIARIHKNDPTQSPYDPCISAQNRPAQDARKSSKALSADALPNHQNRYFVAMTGEELFEKLSNVKISGGACAYTLEKCEAMAPLINAINALKKERNAVILAHSYVSPEILYGVADFTGDSYGLAKDATRTRAGTIIFASVRFMGETAKILNPEKEVLIPGTDTGCTLADAVTGAEVRRLRREFPEHTFVCYINTTAEVKAECDVCVTSSNVYDIAAAIPNDRIFFLPDKLMGKNLQEEMIRRGLLNKQIEIFDGVCYVHEQYDPEMVQFMRLKFPGVKVLSHPECSPGVLHASDYVGSTSQMMNYVEKSKDTQFVMLTECGLSSRLMVEFPEKQFVGSCTLCKYMKSNTLEGILRVLIKPRPGDRVDLSGDVMRRARRCIDAMFAYADAKAPALEPS